MSGTLAYPSSCELTFCLFIKIHYIGKNQFNFSVLVSSLMFPPLVVLVNTHFAVIVVVLVTKLCPTLL